MIGDYFQFCCLQAEKQNLKWAVIFLLFSFTNKKRAKCKHILPKAFEIDMTRGVLLVRRRRERDWN